MIHPHFGVEDFLNASYAVFMLTFTYLLVPHWGSPPLAVGVSTMVTAMVAPIARFPVVLTLMNFTINVFFLCVQFLANNNFVHWLEDAAEADGKPDTSDYHKKLKLAILFVGVVLSFLKWYGVDSAEQAAYEERSAQPRRQVAYTPMVPVAPSAPVYPPGDGYGARTLYFYPPQQQ